MQQVTTILQKDLTKCIKCGDELSDLNSTEVCYYCTNLMQLPKIFQNLTDSYGVKQSVIDNFNKSLFLTGGTGSGKTSYLVFMCKYRWRKKLLAKFINFPDWLNRAKININNLERSAVRLKEFPGLLGLDDIGAEKGSEFVIEKLYLIIDHRQSNGLQTVITSNFTLDELTKKTDPRITSRIKSMCIQMMFNGDKR